MKEPGDKGELARTVFRAVNGRDFDLFEQFITDEVQRDDPFSF
jgi:hypothetical protein